MIYSKIVFYPVYYTFPRKYANIQNRIPNLSFLPLNATLIHPEQCF